MMKKTHKIAETVDVKDSVSVRIIKSTGIIEKMASEDPQGKITNLSTMSENRKE